MESQPQNPEIRNNRENFHPYFTANRVLQLSYFISIFKMFYQVHEDELASLCLPDPEVIKLCSCSFEHEI